MKPLTEKLDIEINHSGLISSAIVVGIAIIVAACIIGDKL